jgi:NAD(P)-dependent dehydrogenase (short-subunit alcohol dehydrogenase family)
VKAMGFEGKVAMVTGASQGIGAATALAFAERGAALVINHRNREVDVRTVGAQAKERGAEDVLVVEADVSHSDDVARMFEHAHKRFGRVDILVNNAGVITRSRIVDLQEEDWDHVIAVNLTGTFHCVRAALPRMIELGYGRIINLSSELALVGAESRAHYCAAKGGVIAFTKALALEAAPHGITANAVAPGPTDTEMLRSNPEAYTEEARMAIPLRRWARPDEIAATVCFVASDEASYFTGWVFSPNGGSVM